MPFRNWNFRQKPAGWWKRLLHLPVYLFRFHLGFLLGDRILLLHHQGRRSGKSFETPLEVVEHDTASGEYIVCSGTGPHADWYRNILHRPAERVQVGNRSWNPAQRLLSQQEAAARFAAYESLHPRTAARLLTSMGSEYDGTDRGRYDMMASMPMVAFGPPS